MTDLSSYRWEKGINATWENVQEDESGRIISVNQERERSHQSKRQRLTQSIRRGLIRYLVIGIDCSKAAEEKDYRPSRLEACKQQLITFVKEYYDQNPISQLAIGVTRDRVAEKISDLSSNSKSHIKLLQDISYTKGLPSLQNLLKMIIHTVQFIPNYGQREAIILYNSISSCDPGNIFQTLQECQALHIRIHMICLSAEVHICKQIAEMTGGRFFVALHITHLQEILQQLTIPTPELLPSSSSGESAQLQTEFLYLGFPKRSFDSFPHFGFDGKRLDLLHAAYSCPRCATKSMDIPTVCCVCQLSLNSSSHIARSFHHLFPVPNYLEYTAKYDPLEEKYYAEEVIEGQSSQGGRQEEEEKDGGVKEGKKKVWLEKEQRGCRGCLFNLQIPDKLLQRCPQCQSFFCVDCDLFIHDSLHNCPGCLG